MSVKSLQQSARTSLRTFGDLPVLAEAPTQRDGDGGQVGHLVAVAVHSAVPPGADPLGGQAGTAGGLLQAGPLGPTALTGDNTKGRLVTKRV
jgi:hypothetical protein